jgi:hypothetical protein
MWLDYIIVQQRFLTHMSVFKDGALGVQPLGDHTRTEHPTKKSGRRMNTLTRHEQEDFWLLPP